MWSSNQNYNSDNYLERGNMSKQNQIIFQSPSPFPHKGDAHVTGKMSSDINQSNLCESENIISNNKISAKSLVICEDSNYEDSRSKLHVGGCISLSSVTSAPTKRLGDNTYLYSLNGDLVYNHNNGKQIVLSDSITKLESTGKGRKLVSDDGKTIKSIVFRDGFATSESDEEIVVSLPNQLLGFSNVGNDGEGLYAGMNGNQGLLKRIHGGSNISISTTNKAISISYSGRKTIELSNKAQSDEQMQTLHSEHVNWDCIGGYNNAHIKTSNKNIDILGGFMLYISNVREGSDYYLYVTNDNRKSCKPFNKVVSKYSFSANLLGGGDVNLSELTNMSLSKGQTMCLHFVSTINNKQPWSFYLNDVMVL